jgi:hypothetical protein
VQRSQRGELARLRAEMVRSRLAVVAARESMIEALGDWMCGGVGAPPSDQQIATLCRLIEIRDDAEAAYTRSLATQSMVAHAPWRRRAQEERGGWSE